MYLKNDYTIFPKDPKDKDVYVFNDRQYTYDDSSVSWIASNVDLQDLVSNIAENIDDRGAMLKVISLRSDVVRDVNILRLKLIIEDKKIIANNKVDNQTILNEYYKNLDNVLLQEDLNNPIWPEPPFSEDN